MDVISLPIELDNDKIDGKFRLVNIVIQRAKDLTQGAKPKVKSEHKKMFTIAIEEALNDKLEYITGEEAMQAKEEAKKLDYKKFLESKKKETKPEDLTELEKDLETYLTEKEESKDNSIEDIFNEGGEKE